MLPLPPPSTLFPYTTLFRSSRRACGSRTSATPSPSLLRSGRGSPVLGRPSLSVTNHYGCSSTSDCTCRGFLRSEEHTSELQSRRDLVCRLLLEKKKNRRRTM